LKTFIIHVVADEEVEEHHKHHSKEKKPKIEIEL